MSNQEYVPATAIDAPYLQLPPGRRFVRSFLFSRRANAPLARVHLLTRIVLVLCLSAAQLRAINTSHPDLAGAIALWIPSVCLFLLSGMHTKIARIYVLLMLPTLFSLFMTWTLLYPVPGTVTLWRQPVYAGYVTLGIAVWEVIWLAIVIGYYCWRRALLSGILLASVISFVLAHLFTLPAWNFTRLFFFHSLTIVVTDRGVLLALTKMIGYSGMILATVALVATSCDTELIGALRQLRVPQPIIFFLTTVFRALTLALSDYETVHQAQIARAINARPRSFLRRLRDLGSIAVPMVAMMIRRSSEMGDALLVRGYRLRQETADFYETSPGHWIDWVIIVCSLGLLYLAVASHPTLTALLQKGI